MGNSNIYYLRLALDKEIIGSEGKIVKSAVEGIYICLTKD
jgi:hypothetical protein